MGTFLYRNRFGLGSDLHVWGQGLCNGMQLGMRIRTVGDWTWLDQKNCASRESPMLCYFPQAELNCPGDLIEAREQPDFDASMNLSRSNGVVNDYCQQIYQGLTRQDVRRSALEFLFANLSPLVVEEAERQLNLVFDGLEKVPDDLIAVHIRWGDKEKEMKLVSINEYIKGIQQIIEERKQRNREKNGGISKGIHGMQPANIYLATEDPKAVQAFRDSIPPEWNLYVDQAFEDLLPHRVAEYNGSPKMSKSIQGRAGLIALGSLLVAMEANDYVLTTASNWSRLMNELRQTIVDSRCGNCTRMVDLRRVRNEW